jgi:hypothetical protein
LSNNICGLAPNLFQGLKLFVPGASIAEDFCTIDNLLGRPLRFNGGNSGKNDKVNSQLKLYEKSNDFRELVHQRGWLHSVNIIYDRYIGKLVCWK